MVEIINGYSVVPYYDGPWWWRQKLYAVESDYGRLLGFTSEAEARDAIRWMVPYREAVNAAR